MKRFARTDFRFQFHPRDISRNVSTVPITTPISSTFHSQKQSNTSSLLQNPKPLKPNASLNRYIHSTPKTNLSSSATAPNLNQEDSEDADGTTNEFLSRFVWIMRGKLAEAYPDADKNTINSMLLIIVDKVVSEMGKGSIDQILDSAMASPSQDFSEDLWKTVWEVSNMVLNDMKKEIKKEKMKGFLLCEEVQEMCRFAGEVGIRGDMLRELRFKWAREKMEESEFYEGLKRIREEAQAKEKGVNENKNENVSGEDVVAEEKPKVVSLPKRHGKIKYKIYGLDLFDSKWTEVADKIHESEEIIWPQEPKPISGKCKLVTEKILSMNEEDDPSSLLAEWMELLQPTRIDWLALLDRLKKQNARLCYKVAEILLSEDSFQTDIRDYSKLIDAYVKDNRLGDAERILKKMNEKGIQSDILMGTLLVNMYSKAGNVDRAKEVFESLKSQGFQPDEKVYNSMIMAYVDAGKPQSGNALLSEMDGKGFKPTKEIYMALLRSFAQRGDVKGTGQISTRMQFAGFQPSLEFCTLLVEAHGKQGEPDQARSIFDNMIKIGLKPDDKCTASMIAAYEKKNFLDKALNLLLQLENDGFEPGVATYTVLLDWMGKLQLVDEAEQLLSKIAEQGEAPPFKVHLSLCDMYSRLGNEKKALQALGTIEAKKDQLGLDDFERIINALIAGGFVQDARRIHGLMEAQGFTASEQLKVALMASQTLGSKRPTQDTFNYFR